MRESSHKTVEQASAKGRFLSKISDKLWESNYEKTVETKFAETLWPVYEKYDLPGAKGVRYIRAPKYNTSALNAIARWIDPLTPEHADLFLKFARWFDKESMGKGSEEELGYGVGLDTSRNAEAALAWVHEYGVLGLGTNPSESFAVVGGVSSNAADIAAERLGRLDLEHSLLRAYSKGRSGGPHETVESFVLEACEANIVLKLYEAATAPKVDMPSITRFMSRRKDDLTSNLPAKYSTFAKTERETYSGDVGSARHWALGVVEDAVNRKVENDVYPILLGGPGSYKEGWGFKSLLGAMWFQMRNFMLGEDNLCPVCGELFLKSRRDRMYCGDKCSGRARAAKAYTLKKQRAEEKREATRKRLRRSQPSRVQ